MTNPYRQMLRPALEVLKAEYEASRECMDALKRDLGIELAAVNEALAVAGPRRGLAISDHAVLRYLERVRGIDIDAIRAEMRDAVSEGQQIAPDAIAGRKKEVYIMSESQIVTVLPAGSHMHRAVKKLTAVGRPQSYPSALRAQAGGV